MIASICSEPSFLEITRIINLFLNIICVAVPIVLIIVLALKFVKVVSSSDANELEKAKKGAITNIVASVLIFLIPTFVNIVVGISFPNQDYKACLKVVSREEINNMYIEKMEELIKKAEESLEIKDYTTAAVYLTNIKDANKREEYSNRLATVHETIEDTQTALQIYGESTGYGRDVQTTEHIKVACKWVLHPDDIKIRLFECKNPEHQHANPNGALPGGATPTTVSGMPTYRAKKTITFREYQFGLFGGEIGVDWPPTFNRMFAILYRNEILASKVWRIVNNPDLGTRDEQQYENGSCTQNYRQNLLDERYYSGKYADIIDAAVKSTQYIILINKDTGKVTDSMYNTKSGIVQVMNKAAKSNDIEGILEAMKSGHTLAYRYKTATLYDCRNILTEDDIAIEAARLGLNYHKRAK